MPSAAHVVPTRVRKRTQIRTYVRSKHVWRPSRILAVHVRTYPYVRMAGGSVGKQFWTRLTAKWQMAGGRGKEWFDLTPHQSEELEKAFAAGSNYVVM